MRIETQFKQSDTEHSAMEHHEQTSLIIHKMAASIAEFMVQNADWKVVREPMEYIHSMGGHFFGMVEFRKIRNDIRDIIYRQDVSIKEKWRHIENLLGDTGCEKYQQSAAQREQRVGKLLKTNKDLNKLNKDYKTKWSECEMKVKELKQHNTVLEINLAETQKKWFDAEDKLRHHNFIYGPTKDESPALNDIIKKSISDATSAPQHMKSEIIYFMYQEILRRITGDDLGSPHLQNGTEAEYNRLAYQNLAKVNQTTQSELDRKHQIIFEKDSRLQDYGDKFKQKNELIEKQKKRIEEQAERIKILETCNEMHQKRIEELKRENKRVDDQKLLFKFLHKKFPWSFHKFINKNR